MSIQMIERLVLKDWYLHRLAIALMASGAIIGVVLAGLPGHVAPGIGVSLVLCLFIAITFYLPLSNVLAERTEKTLPFIMSLPVSPREYTVSKILANLLLYLILWLAVAAVAILVLHDKTNGILGLSDGHFHVVMLGFMVFFTFVLGFAIITESIGWTVALIVTLMFLLGNVATQLVPLIPAARQFLADIALQGTQYYVALGAEVAAIAGMFLVTSYAQSHKRDFL